MPSERFPSNLPMRSELARKSIHLAGLILPVGYVALGPDRARPALVAIAAIVLLADVLRTRWGFARRTYDTAFAGWSRAEEKRRLTGASYLAIGNALAGLLLPQSIAPIAMTFGVVGDPAAALIGKRLGQRTWRAGKTFLGSISCLAFSFAGGVATSAAASAYAPELSVPWHVVMAGAAAAALAEGVSGRLDDNLTIPIVGGLTMWAAIALGV